MIETFITHFQEGFIVFLLPFILTLITLSCGLIVWQKQRLKMTATSRLKFSENTLWLFALSPWGAGMLALGVVNYSGPAHGLIAGVIHWHASHLSSLLSWHSLSALVFSIFLVKYLLRYSVLLIADYKKINLLKQLSTKDGDVYHIESDVNHAFCAGVIRPHCFLSSNLKYQLSKKEYDIVLRHEQAHVDRYDPLRKWLMGMLTAFFPLTVARLIQLNMSLVCEQAADGMASNNNHDKIDVAATLVKFSKLKASKKSSTKQSPITSDFSLAFDHDALRQRVLCLLDDKETKNSTIPPIVITIIVSTSIILVDSSHHLIDSFLLH